jgi:hypothetical protein
MISVRVLVLDAVSSSKWEHEEPTFELAGWHSNHELHTRALEARMASARNMLRVGHVSSRDARQIPSPKVAQPDQPCVAGSPASRSQTNALKGRSDAERHRTTD